MKETVFQYSKQQAATAIAVLFHLIGLAGILLFKSEWIIRSTPANLLLSFVLICWTQSQKNLWFWLFTCLAYCTGIAVEIIGVNTGLLFGEYRYGNILGPQFKHVPLIIGINWFTVVYCSGVAVNSLLQRIVNSAPDNASPSPTIKAVSVITDGATLAVLFDWLIEPVAIKLGFWKWAGDTIPLFNYASWFAISVLLMTAFRFLPFDKNNKFAIHLLLIQVMFFLVLRTFLSS